MPVVRGAVSLVRYRVAEARTLGKDPRRAVSDAVRRACFEPIDRERGDEDRSAGWVEVHDPESVKLSPGRIFFDGEVLLSWRIDQVRVPPSLVRSSLEEWERASVAEHGRKPSKSARAEQKALILQGLRKRAFVTTRTFDVRWRMAHREVQIWATASTVVEEVLVALEESLGLALRPRGPGGRWEDDDALPAEIRPTRGLFGDEVDRDFVE